ncbi:fumarate lyase [Methanohalobium evestigatum Z-7303]|uniref:Fumarate hydratase class II n=1 Tax=Methanohalobium evestigatum (strain ATCC BAA-1072 / DSM 3721 / NBRC 107634 / OCM 161 / Z-7303) TaxID=644295 RepID=D7E9N3_METEZ|nr:aspartate ammonia-lyase [Methanohalobium evestigatum]ADI74305.1 fumarate lyase [Methanohalobium evestigatum Z-7303]
MVHIERDTLGDVEVPDDVYYGPQTARAVINFKISNHQLPVEFIRAQAVIKWASAKSNIRTGKLNPEIGNTIISAASEVRDGKFNDQFVVDAFQSGAGTSQNMNANEVIANRALEILGYEKGRYDIIHPNDHVNMSQSSNDTTHTAIHIAAMESLNSRLIPILKQLYNDFKTKSAEFNNVVKPGRTHLQDAVPITLGQEFSGYTRMLEMGIERLYNSIDRLAELNMGGTAVGTGLNAPEGFGYIAVEEVNRITGLDFKLADNYFEATQSAESILELSSVLRGLAVSLIKIADDFRLFSSGPRTALGEIQLPAVQPGSSIMPGKVNPVMAEMLNMVCYQVMGNDTAIMMASRSGQMDLNVFTPVLAHNLLDSIQIMSGGLESFNNRCLKGITANIKHCENLAESSLSLATALAPKIGYEKAAEVAYQAYNEGKTVRQVILEKDLLVESEVDELLDLIKMTGAGT